MKEYTNKTDTPMVFNAEEGTGDSRRVFHVTIAPDATKKFNAVETPGFLYAIDEGHLVPGKAAKKTDDKTAAEVIAMADTADFKDFVTEAKKLLGDKTPHKKVEIVEALKAL